MLNSQRIGAAVEMAVRAHGNQKRKGTNIPYVSHPLAVASLVMEHGGGEDAVIAALLHDTAEDAGGQEQLDRIRDTFGEDVARIVEECSDCIVADPDQKPDWLERKRAYIAAVPTKCADARLVTACDKLHNARAILADHAEANRTGGVSVWARFAGKTPEQVVAYYSAMARQLNGTESPTPAQDLLQASAALERLIPADEHRVWFDRLL
jgi:(p)ppGpp synthase/HD superfamily hydrolase